MSSWQSRRRFLQQFPVGIAGCALAPACDRGAVKDAATKEALRPSPAAPGSGSAVRAALVIEGGTIVTGDPAAPRVAALAIGGNRILAAGSRESVAQLRGPETRVIDLAGGVAMPGLTDAHAHLYGLGQSLASVDLRGATSVAEVISRVREHAKDLPPGVWVTGRGWDQNLWADKRMPTHQPLTDAFPERPVWLRRVDGHAGWANLRVLRAANLTPNTAAPKGGEILRGAGGQPAGVLIDAAMGLVPVPEPTPADIRRMVLAGQRRVLSLGMVGLHDMGVSANVHGLYQSLQREGGLNLRIHGYADQGWFEHELHARANTPGASDDLYALKGVKLYVDGALGSRGAALLADYHDRAGHRGLLQLTPEALTKLCTQAVAQGYQVASHAIGDRGIRTLLAAYHQALAAHPEVTDARLRVEHAQIVAVEDIPTFAKLGLIASMQPTHATSDMPWVPARIGPGRLPGAYAWQRFLKAGVPLAFGSDFPVEHPNVVHGLYAATTRQDAQAQPPGGWLPDQKLSLDQAVAGFTSGAAYAVHREANLGKLAPGYLADVSCFQENLWEIAPEMLQKAHALATVVNGEVAYES